MYAILLASAVPASLAARFDSPGLALIAAAGGVWALAAFLCTAAPVIGGQPSSLNERIATGLSVAAAAIATCGMAILALALL